MHNLNDFSIFYFNFFFFLTTQIHHHHYHTIFSNFFILLFFANLFNYSVTNFIFIKFLFKNIVKIELYQFIKMFIFHEKYVEKVIKMCYYLFLQ